MKAIIIAAGQGSRLGDLTKDTPKCLLEIDGRTILERQLEVFYANGVKDVSLVKGFCAEKFADGRLKYYLNDDYENNNILNSLMYARCEMTDDFIATYSDILFDTSVVRALVASREDIAVVVDADWEENYVDRSEHPVQEAEKAVVDAGGKLREIGKVLLNGASPTGEFIGMFKCTARGAEVFCEYFARAKAEFAGRPFIRASSFAKAYITDFLQYLIEQGVPVSAVTIRGGWQEIDVLQDLQKVTS